MKKNNFKSLMQAAVLICTPLAIASCDDVFGDVDNPIPSYMSIKEADVNLVLHKDSLDKATYTRTATAATGAEIVYSSSDEKVATVDAKTGKITAVGGGECEIIVEATGKDSHGNMTYQPAQSSFKVKVTDYRARIALKEGVEIPVYNSALASSKEAIALKDILDVWPALDTKGLTIKLTKVENTEGKNDIDPNGIIDNTELTKGKVALTGNSGVAKIIAEITAIPTTPAKYEQTSFPKAQKTQSFTIEVKQGVAYVSGYDAKGVAIQKYMFKDYNGEKYTNLSEVLEDDKGNAITADVSLAAGWYYLDKNLTFAKNLRIKGDVTIILGDGFSLSKVGDILDESAAQTYKLNIFAETGAATGAASFSNIVDFKEINILGIQLSSDVKKVVDVNINKGQLGNMAGTGTVNIIDGTAGNLTGFATVSLSRVDTKAKPAVGDLKTIGTVTIPEGTKASDLSDVKTVTINKAVSIGNLNGIGTANIAGVTANALDNITTLTLNKVKATQDLYHVGTATITDTDGKQTFTNIDAVTLIINGGEIEVSDQLYGYDTKNKKKIDCKLTMNGGKLTVGKSLTGDVFAVNGDVEVTKGEFFAQSKDYHAVSGALVGTFEGSTDNKTWTAITGAERPAYIRNKASE